MNWDFEGTIKDILSQYLPNILKINCITVDSNYPLGGYTCKVISVCVDVTLPGPNGKELTENLKLIMKYIHDEKNEYIKLSLKKEILMYKLAIPEYTSIQKELNIAESSDLNIFPKYYGSNIEDGCKSSISVFLMNDLKSCGYISGESMNELDLDHVKLVIDNLALFHAIGIKLKETRPQIFNDYFKELVEPALRSANIPNKHKIDCEFIENITTILNSNIKLSKFTTRVINMVTKINDTPLPEVKEPFATLLHNDLWKNNLLFKYEDKFDQRSEPLCVKFIDFQFIIYNSPVRDLVHLIYSSASYEVQKNFESVSMYYYEKLMKHLNLLKCNYRHLFNLDKFNEEIRSFGWTKFKHLLSTILNINNDVIVRDDKLFNLFVCFENNEWL